MYKKKDEVLGISGTRSCNDRESRYILGKLWNRKNKWMNDLVSRDWKDIKTFFKFACVFLFLGWVAHSSKFKNFLT